MEDLLAQSFNLIVCDGVEVACDFDKLMLLVKNLINALVILSTFLAVAAFAYAGMRLLASGGNESAKKDAVHIFTSVLKGYLWILAAWVIIYTITSILLRPGFLQLLST